MYYYQTLIKKKKLIKFWIFFGFNFKKIFKINYEFLNVIYNKNSFLNFKKLIYAIKKILPLFLNLLKLNSNFYICSSSNFLEQIIINGLLYFFDFKLLKKISRKTLFGSPATIIIGLLSIKSQVFFNFIEINFRILI